ncbi:MAG: AraC family transcriptional regulator of adaptative response / DNA-3-methyladenine glycosylase II [Planctomycetota bacterium]|jgi:AraC family transcriptional regulator of adaptative response / DNA-3-methyladenine glycosylase II
MEFQAVKTTGIYCRADCGAKPLAKNVASIPSPVAALVAGYRPCLRCRPDRLPNLGLGVPTHELAKALVLVAEGYLDDHSNEELANRVGYSSRHLLRLFDQHVGASPNFVARARRSHLARRLLDESELSITRVAFAAGFSSLRQMNREVRELFSFSPSELRQKRRARDVLDPIDGGLRLRIPYSGTVAGQTLIDYLEPRAIPGVEVVENGRYFRTIETCGYPGVAEVSDPGGGDHLEVTLHLSTFSSIMEQVEKARSLFGLNQDTSVAEKHLGRDPMLAPLIGAHPGVRLAGAWNRFETAIRIIVGQQVSVAGATTVTGRIASRYGRKLDLALPSGLSVLFPTPKRLAKARPTKVGMPQARFNTIVHFAKAVAAGDVDLAGPAGLEQSIKMLEAVPGIGPWTSNLIAARVMGEDDAFPAGDLGLRKAVDRLQGRRTPISAKELEALSESWRPYRSIAAAYLWMSPMILSSMEKKKE